jgi:hypothetical protein
MEIHVSRELLELAGNVLDWGCRKLAAREGFSVLMLSMRAGEKYGTRIDRNTVEEGLEYAEKSLIDGTDAGASEYVLAYDVTVQIKGGPRRGFLLELESSLLPLCLVMFRATNGGTIPGNEPKHVVPEGEYVLWKTRPKRLPAGA